MTKNKWDRPQLIVLTRGKPEEYVLTGCKTMNNVTSDIDTWNGCNHDRIAHCDLSCNFDSGS